jgi:hypothetical protein
MQPVQHVDQLPFHQQHQHSGNRHSAQVLERRTATSLASTGSESSTPQHAMAVRDAVTGATLSTLPFANCPAAALPPAPATSTGQQDAADPATEEAVPAPVAGGGSDSGSSMPHASVHGSHRVLFCSCSICQAAAEAWLRQQDNRIDARNAAAAPSTRTIEGVQPGQELQPPQ